MKIGDLKIREAAELVKDCGKVSDVFCLTECRFYNEEKRECILKSLDAYYFGKIDLEQEIDLEEERWN